MTGTSGASSVSSSFPSGPTSSSDMKVILTFATLWSLTLCAPQRGSDKDATIVRYDSQNIGVDGYSYNFETSNGISAQEDGKLANAGTDNELMQVKGSFTYVGLDGVTYTVTYTADENGFQPQGAHLPQAPSGRR